MIRVVVTYTVKENFISKNKENIAAFLKDFDNLDVDRFSYSICQKENASTFIHISQYKDETIQKELLSVPSFLSFQKQRDENLETQPLIEILKEVGSAGGLKRKP